MEIMAYTGVNFACVQYRHEATLVSFLLWSIPLHWSSCMLTKVVKYCWLEAAVAEHISSVLFMICLVCAGVLVTQEIDPRCGEALCKLFPIDENLDINSIVRKARKAHARNAERAPARPRPGGPDRGRFMRRPDFGPRLALPAAAFSSRSCSVCCHRSRGVTWCVLLWEMCRSLVTSCRLLSVLCGDCAPPSVERRNECYPWQWRKRKMRGKLKMYQLKKK